MTKFERILMYLLVLVLTISIAGFALFLYAMHDLDKWQVKGGLSERLDVAAPQPLDPNHPSFSTILENIRQHSRPEEFDFDTWKVTREIDGDGKPDWIIGGWQVNVFMTNKPTTFTISGGMSDLVAMGLDDIDRDGLVDAWFFDPGDWVGGICWGDPKYGFYGRQGFNIHSYRITGGAFIDVDEDNQPDFIYYDEQPKEDVSTNGQPGFFWIKMTPATSAPHNRPAQ